MSNDKLLKEYAVLRDAEVQAKKAYVKAQIAYDAASAAAEIGWSKIMHTHEPGACFPDSTGGPWLSVIEIDGKWYSPNIIYLWMDVDHKSDYSKVITFPVRWIKTIPEMLVELNGCRKLLDSIEPKTAPPFCEQIQKQIEAVDIVIAKASPPVEGGGG